MFVLVYIVAFTPHIGREYRLFKTKMTRNKRTSNQAQAAGTTTENDTTQCKKQKRLPPATSKFDTSLTWHPVLQDDFGTIADSNRLKDRLSIKNPQCTMRGFARYMEFLGRPNIHNEYEHDKTLTSGAVSYGWKSPNEMTDVSLQQRMSIPDMGSYAFSMQFRSFLPTQFPMEVCLVDCRVGARQYATRTRRSRTQCYSFPAKTSLYYHAGPYSSNQVFANGFSPTTVHKGNGDTSFAMVNPSQYHRIMESCQRQCHRTSNIGSYAFHFTHHVLMGRLTKHTFTKKQRRWLIQGVPKAVQTSSSYAKNDSNAVSEYIYDNDVYPAVRGTDSKLMPMIYPTGTMTMPGSKTPIHAPRVFRAAADMLMDYYRRLPKDELQSHVATRQVSNYKRANAQQRTDNNKIVKQNRIKPSLY